MENEQPKKVRNATNALKDVGKLKKDLAFNQHWYQQDGTIKKIEFTITRHNAVPSLMLKVFRRKGDMRTFAHKLESLDDLGQTFHTYLDALAETKFVPHIVNGRTKEQYFEDHIAPLVEKFESFQQQNAEQQRVLDRYRPSHESDAICGPNKPLFQRQVHPIGEQNAEDAAWLFGKLNTLLDHQQSTKGEENHFLIDSYHLAQDGRKTAITLIDSAHLKKSSFFLQFETPELQQQATHHIAKLLAVHNAAPWKPDLQDERTPAEQYVAFASTLTNAVAKPDIALHEPMATPRTVIDGPVHYQNRAQTNTQQHAH